MGRRIFARFVVFLLVFAVLLALGLVFGLIQTD